MGTSRRIVMLPALAITAILFGAACDKSNTPEAKELDRYLNHDVALPLAQLVDGIHSMDDLRAEDVDDPGRRAAAAHMLRERTLPRLAACLADAPTVKPPKGNEHIHERLLELATAYRTAADDLAAGADAGDATRFHRGHEELMDATERFTRWDHSLMQTVRDHDLKPTPFPALPPPGAPPTANPPAPPSDTVPPNPEGTP